MAKDWVKFAPPAASELMYGASGLPMISPSAWFSSMTTTTWSGRGTAVTAVTAPATEPVPDDGGAAASQAKPHSAATMKQPPSDSASSPLSCLKVGHPGGLGKPCAAAGGAYGDTPDGAPGRRPAMRG